MKLNALAILAVVYCLVGCGASIPPTSRPTPVGVTGNWQLTLTSTTCGGCVGGSATYGIYLTQTGNAVSGILVTQDAFPLCIMPSGLPCAFPFGEVALELVGTADPSGNIVLNSVPDSGGPASLSITASSTDNKTLSGTYSITLVDTSPPGTWTDQGTISGNTIGTLNGTYSGTITSSSGLSMGVTTILSQTPSPDSSGELEVAGSANFTGLPCFTSATVPKPGGLFGNQLVIGFVPTNSSTTTMILSGTLSPDAKTIAVSYISELPINACSSGYSYGELGSGTLTRQ